MNIYDFAILALASGRIAYSVTSEEIFRPVRERVYRFSAPSFDTDRDGVPYRQVEWWKANERELALGMPKWQEDVIGPDYPPREIGFFGCLIECFYCFSFYTTIGLLALWLISPAFAVGLATPFALWSVATIVAAKGL